MKKLLYVILISTLLVTSVSGEEGDFIEFVGDRFTYDQKLEIVKEAIGSLGIENLEAHILSEVKDVKADQIQLVDIRAINRGQSGEKRLILRCHIETTASYNNYRKLIDSCKRKLMSAIKEVERERKST